jgi:undecaprenyl-diphosphatase
MRISGGYAVTEKELPGGMSFDQIHRGLPGETPWFFRVVLRGRRFLIVTLVITALLGVNAAINPEWLLRIDQPVSEWLRGWEGSLTLAKVVTHLGSPNLAIAVGVIAVAFLWRRCRASAFTLGVLVAAALTVDTMLKVMVDRARPPNPAVSTGLGSFPSGHVIHAVIIFGLVPFLLWILTNRPGVLRLGFMVFAVVVLLVAWSRVRLGAHWPSDVIASLFIGASLLLGAEQLLTSTWAAERCAMLGHHPTSP